MLWASGSALTCRQTLAPLISVLVTGIQPMRVCAAKQSLSPKTWAGWISVTSTQMRRDGAL
ncbi:hypothetical protein EYD00_03525 [Agrobacterium sp. 33MFTa1.1]|nr:MAG: hypothetical protein DI546_06060 [Rhizobium sp.]QBJ14443.1 hypothetical protein EYD00_03525 [Agrobacterium sp. 33MFTa1.1]